MTLFNAMVNHGYAPETFLMSTMIPIVKNKQANISCVIDYRAIGYYWGNLDLIFLNALHNLLHLINNLVSRKNCSAIMYFAIII